MPVGKGQTLSGEAIPTVLINRLSGDSHRFSYNTSDNYNAVKAFYLPDKKGSNKQFVLINADNIEPKKKAEKKEPSKAKSKEEEKQTALTDGGDKTKVLRHVYANKANAERGARSAYKKLKRGRAQFSIALAVGRPDLAPETPVQVQGFKDVIDAETWIIEKISHSVSSGGYISQIDLEALLQLD